jgi:hypothetical protein
LYPAGHRVIVFLLVFCLVSVLSRRIVYSTLGWLLYILIDIPMQSFNNYATQFLWPVSDYRIDGIAWGTPWFWMTTYGALVLVYGVMWKRGLLTAAVAAEGRMSARRLWKLLHLNNHH